MQSESKLTDLMSNIPLEKQVLIISHALHEVGGMDFETANVQAQLFLFKSLYTSEIDEYNSFLLGITLRRFITRRFIKRRFRDVHKSMRSKNPIFSDKYSAYKEYLPIFPVLYNVRQCIEDFYSRHSRNGKMMQYGYWKSIYEVLTEHPTAGRIFRNEFELSGCRQGSSDEYRSSKKKKGRPYFVEASYWISPSIVSHYAKSNKITDLDTARKTLQKAIHRALRNTAPQNHEEVKAEFAGLLDKSIHAETIFFTYILNRKL